MTRISPVVIAFDADDTLWDNQLQYDDVENRYCRLLSAYGNADDVRASLYEVEKANMATMGYGTKAFVLSLIQNALTMSHDSIDATVIRSILDMGHSLLRNPATPLDGVLPTLQALHDRQRYHLACFTKGDLLDQENKLIRSGLRQFFQTVEIVSEKTADQYLALCSRLGIAPHQFMMVGNSFRSDIHPILQLGGYGIHIPYKHMWQYEHTEEYEHQRMTRIKDIRELLDIVE